MKPLVLTFVALTSMAGQAFSQPSTPETTSCESSKEFITTFEFLRNNSDLAGSGDNALKVASEVAAGCTGAAKRFIQTANFLKKVEIPYSEVLSTSIEFAKKEDANVEAFNQIFKRAYAEDGFDLDLATSLKLAKAVAVEYPGNVKAALKDFEKVSDFCMQTKEVSVPRPACADLAKSVSLSAKEKGPTASEAFIDGFRYLKNTVGLANHDALKLSEHLVHTDPQAFNNFKLSYEYAISEAGLKANKEQAIQFGKKMALLTAKETKN